MFFFNFDKFDHLFKKLYPILNVTKNAEFLGGRMESQGPTYMETMCIYQMKFYVRLPNFIRDTMRVNHFWNLVDVFFHFQAQQK